MPKHFYIAAFVAGILNCLLVVGGTVYDILVHHSPTYGNHSVFAALSYDVLWFACLVVYSYGFILISRTYNSRLLESSVYLTVIISLIGYFGAFAIHTPQSVYGQVPLFGLYMLAIGGAVSIARGWALFELENGLGQLAPVAGILNILVGIGLIAPIEQSLSLMPFFLFSGLLTIPVFGVESVLLFKEARKQ